MSNLRLRTRLLISYLLVLGLGLGALTAWIGIRLQNATVEQREHELETEAFLLGLSLSEDVKDVAEDASESEAYEQSEHEAEHTSAAQRRLSVFRDIAAQEYERTVNIYDPAGRPLLGSTFTGEQLPSEVAIALTGNEAHAIRDNPATQSRFLFVAVPIFNEQQLVGAVQLGEPFTFVQEEITRTWIVLLLSAGTLSVIGAGVAVWLARSIASPLQVLTRTAEAIAEGNLSRRTEIRGTDEIGRLAGAFDRMADQLTILLEQQRQFVADASHELRTPLTAIGLRAEALLNGARDDDDVADRYLGEILSETGRMKHIIENLLTLSRVEAGLDQLQQEDVALDDIVHRAVAGIRPIAEEQEVHIEQDIAPAGVIVYADDVRLQRALVNLLSNAVKYAPAGGTVILGARYPDADHAGALHLWVHDTGSGIPQEDLPHLFERFYRVDKARDRAAGGTGLGLAIVKAIVEAHHGHVWAESALGEGTTFHIVLPGSVVLSDTDAGTVPRLS